MVRKKIKFALKLKDDVEVRNLQELREGFDLNQVVAYLLDGKLETWLMDRYYEDLAEKIGNLDKSDPELRKKLCEIFGVEYEEDSLSVEEIEERNRRIKKLKEITDDEEIIKNVDKVAFCQEELADLLDEGQKTIYLCGTDFHIPVSKKGIRYTGIETKLEITEEARKKYESNDIELINLLDEEEKKAEKHQSEEIMNSYCDDIYAIILCKLYRYGYEDEGFLAYITKEVEPYKEDSFNKANLPAVQYQAYLKKLESVSLNIRTCKDAFYNGNKIIYTAEDGQGEFLAVMDCNGENNKILKRLSKSNFDIACVGKSYILAYYRDSDFNMIYERISIEGTIDEIESLKFFSVFYEMPQGFFSIDKDGDDDNEGIILYELLNEKTEVRKYNISIKDYKIYDKNITSTNNKWFDLFISGLSSRKIHSVYNDTDTGKIYFFWEPGHRSSDNWINGQGYFYYLDINTKEANRAVYQSILLDIKDFVVKDTRIIYFEKNNGKFCLTALDMNSGRKEYLWEELDSIDKYSGKAINLIGEYLYFIIKNSENGKDIYRIKVDGSEKTIVKVDKSNNLGLTYIKKICS